MSSNPLKVFGSRRLRKDRTSKSGDEIQRHGSIRGNISAPVSLIHTTNMLSYSSPDIAKPTTSRAAAAHRSPPAGVPALYNSSNPSLPSTDDECETPRTDESSPPTSPDVSPAVPHYPPEQEKNRLSTEFAAPSEWPGPVLEATHLPIPPRRDSRKPSYGQLSSHSSRQPSLSHDYEDHLSSRITNLSFEYAAHSQFVSHHAVPHSSGRDTVSTKASLTFSRSSSTSTARSSVSTPRSPLQHKSSMPFARNASTSSLGMARRPPSRDPSVVERAASPPPPVVVMQSLNGTDYNHPFGHELAQVTELAEEYGIKGQLDLVDDEEREMARKGLEKWSADVYLAEIDALMETFFSPSQPAYQPVPDVWI